MNKQFADFLLKGGRLIDPAGRKDGLFDIRVCNGRIDAIGTNLEPNGATVIDVKDHIVTPGLIDVHLHLMKGLGALASIPIFSASARESRPLSTPAARVTRCSMYFAIM